MARTRYDAREFVEMVADEGSFERWPSSPHRTSDPDYRIDLEKAREATGLDEAVLTGRAMLDGHPVALVVSEFGFLGGSIGHTTSDQILRAIERATDERLPLLMAPCSGGTRMQEGTTAFVQMIKIAQAAQAHRRAGLPYLVYLRHPTTGGVFASWGSLGQVTLAEPEALVGFLGPRAQEAISGTRIEEGVQRSENLFRLGIVDGVVPVGEVRPVWARVLKALGAPSVVPGTVQRGRSQLADAADPWEAVVATRHERRPGLAELVHWQCEDVVWLSGTGDGQMDPVMRVGLARLDGLPMVLVGQNRALPVEQQSLSPAGLRLAQRGYRLAQELGLPVVNLIDTPGGALTKEAEESALAGEIARTLGLLADLTVPTISVLLGRGGGGVALAMLPSDRTLGAQNGWLAPLPPEGASAIVHRSAERAAEMARLHRLGVNDLHAEGVVHEVIQEPEDPAADGGEAFSRAIAEAISHHLRELAEMPTPERLVMRRDRFKLLG
ncbi:carboxyl transferase domain-containing protein [Luteococcus sp. Sow4_B9]|uniref:carboxyl transferase domain-containing protein n=1 Tax=Luteococcus sp. Sow4_B9 TaxID=3438792 RepID=UPI003F99B457